MNNIPEDKIPYLNLMKRWIWILAVLFFPLLNLKAQNEIATADSAYNAGDYNSSISNYVRVIEEQGVSAALLYNLGNAYVQVGDFGQAMLCYERAHKLNPSNREIKMNLNYLTEKVEDANKAEQRGKRLKVTEDEPNFFRGVQKGITENTSSNTWAVWGVVCFLLFSGCVVLYLFSTGIIVRKFGFFGGLILLGLSMICVVFAYMGAASGEEQDYGIITAYKVSLQTEPSVDKNKDGEILTRGTKIRIVSEETDAEGQVTWYKVRLNSDYNGWIEAKDIAII